MVSKVFDGFTDLVAGYLIDHTRTKLGKGRPYELALIGYMASLALIFCASEMGGSTSCVYLFVMYSLVNSVFMTLLSCADPVYLANALEDQSQSVSILAFTGFISLVFTMGASMLMPQMVATMGTTREGWAKIAMIITIPCTLIGFIRFLVVKERADVIAAAEASNNKITVKDMLHLLAQNRTSGREATVKCVGERTCGGSGSLASGPVRSTGDRGDAHREKQGDVELLLGNSSENLETAGMVRITDTRVMESGRRTYFCNG